MNILQKVAQIAIGRREVTEGAQAREAYDKALSDYQETNKKDIKSLSADVLNKINKNQVE